MSSHSPFDEAAAVAALRRGRTEGLASVYRQYHGRLIILLQHRAVHLCEADYEDILHNVFIQLEQLIHSYNPHKGRLYPWLARIVLNESRDFNARNRGYQWLNDTDVLPGADFPEQSVCFQVCIEKALKCCEQAKNRKKLMECLQAICLFAENGCVAETATLIGRTPRATGEFLSQSRKKLMPYLGACLVDCGLLIPVDDVWMEIEGDAAWKKTDNRQ